MNDPVATAKLAPIDSECVTKGRFLYHAIPIPRTDPETPAQIIPLLTGCHTVGCFFNQEKTFPAE